MTGVFSTWNECKKHIDGFSGAIYKSFPTVKEAEDYLSYKLDNQEQSTQVFEEDTPKKTLIAYVDGSYSKELDRYSYGCILLDDKKTILSGAGDKDEIKSMRNVAGELLGAMKAIKWASENKYQKIIIHHDYEGIARWAEGDWKATKIGTKKYIDFIAKYMKIIDIKFEKVLAHSGDTYNEEADSVAKKALQDSISQKQQISSNGNEDSLKLFEKIMLQKDKSKNSFNIKFKSYYISESRLKKFVRELWELEGKDATEIDAISMVVETNLYKIHWQVKDKTGESFDYEFKLI